MDAVLGLYRVSLNQEAGAAAGTATRAASVAGGFVDGLAIAANGTVVYGIASGESALWAVDLKADGTASDPVPVIDDAVRLTMPSYSPDGRRLAYQQWGVGVEASTWIMDENGEHREPLVAEGTSASPSWSGGTAILVQRGFMSSRPQLSLVDSQTHRGQPLTGLPAEGVRNPRLSPDGRTVAYWRLEANGAMNSFTQAIDGSQVTRVTSDAEAINYPAWSPDGRWLAVEIKRGAVTHVGVVSRDGGPVEQLTHDAGQSWPQSWSPDGEWITFAGERRAVWNIWAVSRRTKITKQLTHFTSASGYVRYPAWSPRGNRIVFERQAGESSIWMLTLPKS